MPSEDEMCIRDRPRTAQACHHIQGDADQQRLAPAVFLAQRAHHHGAHRQKGVEQSHGQVDEVRRGAQLPRHRGDGGKVHVQRHAHEHVGEGYEHHQPLVAQSRTPPPIRLPPVQASRPGQSSHWKPYSHIGRPHLSLRTAPCRRRVSCYSAASFRTRSATTNEARRPTTPSAKIVGMMPTNDETPVTACRNVTR